MGIIGDFLKKVGIRKSEETYLLDDKKMKSIREKMNEQQDEFNKYLEFQPSHPSQEIFVKDLLEETKEDEIESEVEKERIKVFSYKDQSTGQIFYEMELEMQDGNVIPISTVKEMPNREALENIVKQISGIISSVRESSNNGEKNDKIQSELKEKMQRLSDVYNIDFSGNMMHMVENIGARNETNNVVNYKRIETRLPKIIDISRLKPEEILQYGRMLKERLDVLENIATPDDAYENKESLKNFMKHEEKTKTLSAIVSANVENLSGNEKPLDFPTIIAFAKKMETFSNEDGMLYSSYLKLEENRIIRKLQQDISSYIDTLEDVPENISTKDLAEGFIDYLETTKITTEFGNKDSITSYMIDTLQGRGIENYIKNTAKQDMKLRKFLKNNSVENVNESCEYIDAKLACLGQVVDVSESQQYSGKVPLLRDFIEKTEYKDSDVTEVKKFLYKVVQVEKDYIKKNYEPVLLEFQKIVEQNRIEEKTQIK